MDVLQLNYPVTKAKQYKQHEIRQNGRKPVVIINTKSEQKRGPVNKAVPGAEEFDIRKWDSPNQAKQTKHDQRDANPVNQLIGWILMAFGVFIKINIHRPFLSGLWMERFFFFSRHFNYLCIKLSIAKTDPIIAKS